MSLKYKLWRCLLGCEAVYSGLCMQGRRASRGWKGVARTEGGEGFHYSPYIRKTSFHSWLNLISWGWRQQVLRNVGSDPSSLRYHITSTRTPNLVQHIPSLQAHNLKYIFIKICTYPIHIDIAPWCKKCMQVTFVLLVLVKPQVSFLQIVNLTISQDCSVLGSCLLSFVRPDRVPFATHTPLLFCPSCIHPFSYFWISHWCSISQLLTGPIQDPQIIILHIPVCEKVMYIYIYTCNVRSAPVCNKFEGTPMEAPLNSLDIHRRQSLITDVAAVHT
jgi:hypothetical protein